MTRGGGGATKKTRRNAGLWETRNEEMGKSQSRGTGYFFLASPSVITRTHFPEGRCTC